ncbi:MAG TPA: glucosamine-6-phosphate deaminase [Planctomycetota bacterium]|nr:glucosamine-6-phosphate deaminase [Planctomycetota bacterium]
MRICRCASKEQLALDAALAGGSRIRQALHQKGEATIVVATGMSQAGMLSHLVKENIDWRRVTAFHLDEYVGIRATHPASFRKYLQERFVGKVPLKAFHPIAGEKEPIAEVKRLNALLAEVDIDVAFVGIGENGHLAFNDPPAKVDTNLPFLLVTLNEACRKQQVGEGWFKSIREVPPHAITMSIPQILKAEQIICTVPDARKAEAVRAALEGEVTPQLPASYLQQHPRAYVYVDPQSASRLGPSRDPILLELAKLEDFRHRAPADQHFHLFLAADFSKVPEGVQKAIARKVLEAGAVTVTAWGKGASSMELAVDGVCVERDLQAGLGESSDSAIRTHSYKPEDLEEALFLFLNDVQPSPAFEKTCTSAVAVVVGKPPKRDLLLQHLTHPGEFIDGYITAEDDEEPQ